MRRYVYADEAGCFSFRRDDKSSKYFIICTVRIDDPSFGGQLLDLRRELIWKGANLSDYFHCSEDKQAVRDEVFALICRSNALIGATILEKSKAQPQIKVTKERFYKHAWYFHLSGVAPKIAAKGDEVLFTTASVGTRKEQAAFSAAVRDVVSQRMFNAADVRTHFCQSAADPCLQLADYCTWAIQRKWERGDGRSYDVIRHLIHHEFETWKHGTTHYY
jgi:hypothetical protein